MCQPGAVIGGLLGLQRKTIISSRKATKEYALVRSPPPMMMDADVKESLASVERGEWKPAKGGKRKRTQFSRFAKATFRKVDG